MKGREASGKPLGSLEICALSPLPFCLAHFPVGSWTHSRLHNLLNGITDSNKLKWPKNTSSPIARLSHEWKVRTFLLFAISISLRWKQLLGNFFFFGGGGVKNPSPFVQCNTQNFSSFWRHIVILRTVPLPFIWSEAKWRVRSRAKSWNILKKMLCKANKFSVS